MRIPSTGLKRIQFQASPFLQEEIGAAATKLGHTNISSYVSDILLVASWSINHAAVDHKGLIAELLRQEVLKAIAKGKTGANLAPFEVDSAEPDHIGPFTMRSKVGDPA